MKTKSLRNSIIAMSVCIVLCTAMLIGATYAWFTDGATNSGNVITAGTLKIDAFAYDAVDTEQGGMSVTIAEGDVTGTFNFESEGQNLKEDTTPIIDNVTIEPGDTEAYARLVEVVNNGNLDAKVKLHFDVTEDGLAGALWFDFVQVDDEGIVVGKMTKRPMSTLSALAEKAEFVVAAGKSLKYVFLFGMNDPDTVGNEFQGKSFGMDVVVLASQNVEGAEYAEYVVESADEMTAALAEGGSIKLAADIELQSIPVAEDGVKIDLAGKKLVLSGTPLTRAAQGYRDTKIANGQTLEIVGGTVELKGNDFQTSALSIEGGKLVLDDVDLISAGTAITVIGNGSELVVKDSTINTTDYGCCVSTNASGAENYPIDITIDNSELVCAYVDGWTSVGVLMNVPGKLNMKDSTVKGGLSAVVVRGGDAVLENCTLERPYTPKGFGNLGPESNYNMNENWGSGNDLPLSTLLVGNRSTSYQYATNVELIGCTITAAADGAKTVYVYGNATEEIGASLTYDSATVITPADKSIEPVIVGGGYVTVNGEVASQ